MTRGWIAAALAAVSLPAAAASVDGRWRTEATETGAYLVVEIGPCDGGGAARCGVIVGGEGPNGREPGEAGGRADRLLGRRMIEGMSPEGDGEWDDGTIWAPDEDETYDASMRLEGGALHVEGCYLLVACRSQRWTRVE